MDKLKLLIVDDAEDNRLILRAICNKLEGFEIKDAVDGLEAIDMVQSWRPHIVLMDIMMPNMDGFEATRIIKERYPDIVVMVVTAVLDSRVYDHMSSLGVEIYINKPIDRELIRYKLESVGSALRLKLGAFKKPSTKIAVNPFNSDIRSFRTFFEVLDTEAMMDFGMWLFDQFNGRSTSGSNKFDKVIELFYMLMSQGNKNGETMAIIVEESYEEFYITIKFDRTITVGHKVSDMLQEFGTKVIVKENILCLRLSKPLPIKTDMKETAKNIEETTIKNTEIQTVTKESEETKQEEQEVEKQESVKEVRVVHSNERELLHQSFVNKTSAEDYVDDIGGDVLDEIRDLSSLDEEWMIKLRDMEDDPCERTFADFADSVLNVYVKTINSLFEFTALAYALSALSVFIKDSAEKVSQDSAKVRKLVMLLEYLGTDLSSWREHIFILQDTADIHYLDSSFFSSCMQIEGIISDKQIGDEDDDDDMEFF